MLYEHKIKITNGSLCTHHYLFIVFVVSLNFLLKWLNDKMKSKS